MRKRKHGERRYCYWVKSGLLFLMVAFIFILSVPTIYALLTYYHIPDIEQNEARNWIARSEKPNEICVGNLLGETQLCHMYLNIKL